MAHAPLATGAEAATAVNNNAAAVLLVLSALARDRQVLVSRGESVEIGGGFRVPEVMEQSGAHLIDVGTTNRTRLADYSKALHRRHADVALVLKVHPSNYRVEGFVEDTPVDQLATLPVPVVADIGSGAGLPGLVLAILGAPEVHLVESDQRKVAFQREVARAVGAGTVMFHVKRI